MLHKCLSVNLTEFDWSANCGVSNMALVAHHKNCLPTPKPATAAITPPPSYYKVINFIKGMLLPYILSRVIYILFVQLCYYVLLVTGKHIKSILVAVCRCARRLGTQGLRGS